jgi:predicted site-specific integrase-resolvase
MGDDANGKYHGAKLAYSMREAAGAIGVSYIQMHRFLKRGLIKCSSVSRTKIIPATELERFLKVTLH